MLVSEEDLFQCFAAPIDWLTRQCVERIEGAVVVE
jgi:hypothetical protein